MVWVLVVVVVLLVLFRGDNRGEYLSWRVLVRTIKFTNGIA